MIINVSKTKEFPYMLLSTIRNILLLYEPNVKDITLWIIIRFYKESKNAEHLIL